MLRAGASALTSELERRSANRDWKLRSRVADAIALAITRLADNLLVSEDSPLGVVVDVEALTIELLDAATPPSDGVGLRAAIGFGFLSVSDPGSFGDDFSGADHQMMAVPYDEVGLRWRHRLNRVPLRLGVHATVSGALVQLVDTGDLRNPVMFGGGAHVTVYDSIDLSVTGGCLRASTPNSGGRQATAYLAFGVQLPLVDYLRGR